MDSTTFPIHIKMVSGEILTLSFDSDKGLSCIQQTIAEQMNCHPSQVYLFPLTGEKEDNEVEAKESDVAWIPSTDELVGVLITDPLIAIECIRVKDFGTLHTYIRYIKYKFSVKVFDQIYSTSFYYACDKRIFYPLSSCHEYARTPSRRFLPGIEIRSNEIYDNFSDIVTKMKLPESLVDHVIEKVQDPLWVIQFESINDIKNRLQAGISI